MIVIKVIQDVRQVCDTMVVCKETRNILPQLSTSNSIVDCITNRQIILNTFFVFLSDDEGITSKAWNPPVHLLAHPWHINASFSSTPAQQTLSVIR
eukprot:scaffold375638_cov58-Attheya_sp.AAC.3